MNALNILIVEDNAMVASLMSELLSMMGHTTCAVEATEAGAVAAAERCAPQLMIVDAQLAAGSGIDAVSTILAKTYVPHLFVSGDAEGVRAAMPHAVILQKPFNEAGLARAIARAVAAIRPAGSEGHPSPDLP
jgi:CheY-like chemotaxis protein